MNDSQLKKRKGAVRRKAGYVRGVQGRVSTYEPAIEPRVTLLALLGKTNDQIAEILGIEPSTFRNWSSHSDPRYQPNLGEAIKKGRAVMSSDVVGALYKKAVGFVMPEEKIFCNAEGQVTRVTVDKYYPPDTGAIAFLLKNKEPELWRDRHELDAGDGLKSLIAGWHAAAARLSLTGEELVAGGAEAQTAH